MQHESLSPDDKVQILNRMPMHTKINESLFHLKIKTYLQRIILMHNTNIARPSLLIRILKY
jgi:hypothetical protein